MKKREYAVSFHDRAHSGVALPVSLFLHPLVFGTLRFILALLVVAAHCELAHHINLGVSAVITFFLLSGFVMTATIRRYYNSLDRYGSFVLDRVNRIFPQYLFWLALTLCWLAFFPFEGQLLGVHSILENVLLLPLMFVVYDLKPIITGTVYVSQAWSLSLEWYFYMLLPLALLLPGMRWWMFGGSFVVFALAGFNVIDSYNYGYHLLPGVFFVFLIGSFLFEEREGTVPPQKTLLAFALIVVVGILVNTLMTMNHAWTPEVMVGLLGGIPLVFFLSKFSSHRLDDTLGQLSYGVFLSHNLVLAFIYKTHFLHSRWAIFCWAALGSSVLGYLSYCLVERPFFQMRRRRRDRELAVG